MYAVTPYEIQLWIVIGIGTFRILKAETRNGGAQETEGEGKKAREETNEGMKKAVAELGHWDKRKTNTRNVQYERFFIITWQKTGLK